MTDESGAAAGAVAGRVFSTVDIPPSVLLMGPNHTGYGARAAIQGYSASLPPTRWTFQLRMSSAFQSETTGRKGKLRVSRWVGTSLRSGDGSGEFLKERDFIEHIGLSAFEQMVPAKVAPAFRRDRTRDRMRIDNRASVAVGIAAEPPGGFETVRHGGEDAAGRETNEAGADLDSLEYGGGRLAHDEDSPIGQGLAHGERFCPEVAQEREQAGAGEEG